MTHTRHRWLWLGLLATALGHLRWGVDVLAWLAPVFWLHHLRSVAAASSTRARRLGLLGWSAAFALAWTLAVLKITSAPLPHAFALLYSIPTALLLGWPYLVWYAALRRELPATHASLAFAAAMVVAEWSSYALTPFGTWGMLANAALDDLPLLQLAALAGPTAIGFVLHLLAATLEQGWAHGRVRALAWASAAFVLAHVWGAARIAWLDEQQREQVVVAAIGTDADTAGLPLPEPARVAAWNAALHERTRVAARSGAALVVWTEAATLVLPDGEARFVAEVGELAAAEQVAIVAGYIKPLTLEPLRYENVYVLARPDGGIEQRYLKHHPVPGEPALPGREPVPVWTSELLGRVSGAICYDFDFPALAREHARAEVDLVALPSSDWRGIDPIHSEMARLRAIEGGFSIVRSTRFGLATGIDATGRMRGRLSAFEGERRILMLSLPRRRTWTLYGWAGEWFVLVCALGLATLGVRHHARA